MKRKKEALAPLDIKICYIFIHSFIVFRCPGYNPKLPGIWEPGNLNSQGKVISRCHTEMTQKLE